MQDGHSPMHDPHSRLRAIAHRTHVGRLERAEAALAAGRDADDALRSVRGGCSMCARDAARLVHAADRIRRAAPLLLVASEPPSRVRDRVRAAALGAADGPPPLRRPRTARWAAPLAWGSVGGVVGALALAVALTLGDAAPVTATFRMTGSELAPGAVGVAELRPADGGSVEMRVQLRGVPPSRPGEFYELWWVGPDKRHVSCGTFRSDGTPLDLRFTAGVDVGSTVLMEITLERDDGDSAPGPHIAQ